VPSSLIIPIPPKENEICFNSKDFRPYEIKFKEEKAKENGIHVDFEKSEKELDKLNETVSKIQQPENFIEQKNLNERDKLKELENISRHKEVDKLKKTGTIKRYT